MITFRQLNIEDLPILNRIRNEYSHDFLHDSRTFTLDESITWFTLVKPKYYCILLNEKMIGYFRLSNYSNQNKNIYVGADIAPEFTGRGYGFESYKKFIPYLFDEYSLNKISLEVLSTNQRAISLYKKLGFTIEGTKRQDVLKNTEWVDSVMMSILKSEYENLYKQ